MAFRKAGYRILKNGRFVDEKQCSEVEWDYYLQYTPAEDYVIVEIGFDDEVEDDDCFAFGEEMTLAEFLADVFQN